MTNFIFSERNTYGIAGLSSTDGTAANTSDLNLANFSFSPITPPGFDFVEFNNQALFLGFVGSGGQSPISYGAVFSTDGTAKNTTATTIGGYGGPATPDGLWVVGKSIVTSGPTEEQPPGLWASTDGTSFNQIETGVGTAYLVTSHGIGFFNAFDKDGNNAGLWRTDGSASGTYSITPSGTVLNPLGFVSVGNGKTVFINGGANGAGALWVTDGSSIGTQEIGPVALGVQAYPGGASTGSNAIFAAIDAASNISVWASDGTSAGTKEIAVSGPSQNPIRTPSNFVSIGDRVIYDSGYSVVSTDGTFSNTTALTSLQSSGLTAVGNQAFFVLGTQPPANALYVTNGLAAGTHAINIPNLTSIPTDLTAVGNELVFTGLDASGTEALFTSDGTTAGTGEVGLPAGVTVTADAEIGAVAAAVTPPPPPQPIVTLPGGNQVYTAAAGTTVVAGAGNDTIIATAGNVTVTGNAGVLTFFGGAGASSVFGSNGSTLIFGGTGGGNFVGGTAGNNILVSQGAAGNNTTLTGAGAGDRIFGSTHGNDLLVAGAGRESILGGGGPTTIQGGTAADVIFTGAGATVVYGGTGTGDTIVGGNGALAVTAKNGDAIFGNAGKLNVTGSSSGADSIVGGSGGLTVAGRGGNMLVVAGTGNSNITTGNGASLVFGGTGASTITGGTGSMQVVLGAGKATITDGSGPASFDVVKNAAGGSDVVSGFKVGTDKISLFGYAAADLHISTGAGNTLVSLSDGTKIQILGVTNLGNSIVG